MLAVLGGVSVHFDKSIKIFFIGILTFVSACGNNVKFKIAEQTQYFSQGLGSFTNNQLDILWVVDNSLSMLPLQTNMVTNFGSIITMFKNKGYDFHMAVTTTEAYLADPTLVGYTSANASLSLFRDGAGTAHSGVFVMSPLTPNIEKVFVTNATQGSDGSGDERAFSSIKAALSNTSNPSFLRTNSFLSIIILSDEDDFSGNSRRQFGGNDHDYAANTLDPISVYLNYLDTLTKSTGATRKYNINTITVKDATCLANLLSQGAGSIIGQRNMDISNQTNGIVGNICDISFANSLSAIASQMLTLSSQFYLVRAAQVDTIVVYVNNVFIPQNAVNGWTYNSEAHSILFHGSALPMEGAKIGVTYTPTSVF